MRRRLRQLVVVYEEIGKIQRDLPALVYQFQTTARQAEEANQWLAVARDAVNKAHIILER